MDPVQAILITGTAATVGWVYTARRTRMLSRKQHTINIVLQANFDDGFTLAKEEIAPMVREKDIIFEKIDGKEQGKKLRRVLDHFEFVAAGVRSGDVDETLLKNSQEYAFVTLFEAAEGYITSVRELRAHPSLYEHFEWLYARWKLCPPSKSQFWAETILGYPSHPNAAKLQELQRGFAVH